VQSVGIRELKTHTSAIIRRLREDGEAIDITYHGEVVARLLPVAAPPITTEQTAAVLTGLDQLADEIDAIWPDGVSALDAIHDVRREL
jgi:antitoxin (DNA-binding transcriptional repressor) of toxin-antitoxin stability system